MSSRHVLLELLEGDESRRKTRELLGADVAVSFRAGLEDPDGLAQKPPLPVAQGLGAVAAGLACLLAEVLVDEGSSCGGGRWRGAGAQTESSGPGVCRTSEQ